MLFAFNIITLTKAQINVRFDNECLLANSTELGQAILETIGEEATRKLIERDEKVKIVVEVDSTGRVTKILRSDFKYIAKKDSVRLLQNIKSKKHFYICYADGQDHKDLIIKEIRADFRRNKNHWVALFFPGQFHEQYLYYKGKSPKADYIIEKLKIK